MPDIACPKCGYEEPESATECARCGIVFRKIGQPLPRGEVGPAKRDRVRGAPELKIVVIGLTAAIVVYAIPLLRMLVVSIVTLLHEFSHAVAGWLMAMPSVPAFDFQYGGGITHRSNFQIILAVLIAAGWAYAIWFFRDNRRLTIALSIAAAVWLLFITAEWRRDLLVYAAGHLGECILAGIFFWQALSGEGWRNPDVERPLGAFVAFFVEINIINFCWRLTHDSDFLASYREGKGGALMNDLESVALDLHIHTPLNPGIQGVARMLLLFSCVPLLFAAALYLRPQLNVLTSGHAAQADGSGR